MSKENTAWLDGIYRTSKVPTQPPGKMLYAVDSLQSISPTLPPGKSLYGDDSLQSIGGVQTQQNANNTSTQLTQQQITEPSITPLPQDAVRKVLESMDQPLQPQPITTTQSTITPATTQAIHEQINQFEKSPVGQVINILDAPRQVIAQAAEERIQMSSDPTSRAVNEFMKGLATSVVSVVSPKAYVESITTLAKPQEVVESIKERPLEFAGSVLGSAATSYALSKIASAVMPKEPRTYVLAEPKTQAIDVIIDSDKLIAKQVVMGKAAEVPTAQPSSPEVTLIKSSDAFGIKASTPSKSLTAIGKYVTEVTDEGLKPRITDVDVVLSKTEISKSITGSKYIETTYVMKSLTPDELTNLKEAVKTARVESYIDDAVRRGTLDVGIETSAVRTSSESIQSLLMKIEELSKQKPTAITVYEKPTTPIAAVTITAPKLESKPIATSVKIEDEFKVISIPLAITAQPPGRVLYADDWIETISNISYPGRSLFSDDFIESVIRIEYPPPNKFIDERVDVITKPKDLADVAPHSNALAEPKVEVSNIKKDMPVSTPQIRNLDIIREAVNVRNDVLQDAKVRENNVMRTDVVPNIVERSLEQLMQKQGSEVMQRTSTLTTAVPKLESPSITFTPPPPPPNISIPRAFMPRILPPLSRSLKPPRTKLPSILRYYERRWMVEDLFKVGL